MLNQTQIPSLSTVKQFCNKYPAFTEGGLRDRIFYADSNGLKKSGAILRNGRRVLIDEDKFFQWLRGNQA
ncbi:hypothetical protein [Legionella pneumophila]|uniref:hypothetical protein n=1 Tax=Legionella pneumophila TaxID=446 RepID=UPI000482FEFE|nr:hypothetical protein [Legionella pneumophila]AMP90220.1 hypothetical protein AXF35_11195 [Legionella pneumophila subsp. pascullei]AMP92113.1 hypothetical protein AXF36_05605 [Legionella pneumophila subsp. pascullei]AMP95078.1 hypothetical protein AXF37_05495 [Legionella pneumophila subsp. pascullei]HBC0466414.1 hypothetical protein [Legionella pneumophila]HDU8259777.1 hypothetical protein [Legionella pneumophila]